MFVVQVKGRQLQLEGVAVRHSLCRHLECMQLCHPSVKQVLNRS